MSQLSNTTITAAVNSPARDITPEMDFQRLLGKLAHQGLAKEHMPILQRAFVYGSKQHSQQKRLSGEPYIHHPIAVCALLSDLTIDPHSLVAAILHDTIEDTSATLEDIEKHFGQEVGVLVDGLTKIRKITFRSEQEKLAENFRKMVLAMAKDLRVVIIKLCDRLHNMQTINAVDNLVKRQRIAKETLDIYAPLANRLGAYSLKSELEDLCLKELKPEVYSHIARKVSHNRQERRTEVAKIMSRIQLEMDKAHIKKAKVSGRGKHFFSIYKKMLAQKLTFEEIYDLHAVRVIVSSVKECYEILGMIHAIWKPVPGRFKDYIAVPKANLYQSLHTTVVCDRGILAEIQIRTFKMHQICEYGVASHWEYKEQGKLKDGDIDTFRWLRQMMEWQNDITDSREFLEALKVDLFEHEIFVFTPKGDVFRLPHGATPLDFAFSVHTDVGLKTRFAKVNQRMVSLRHPLRNGDIVEVVTSENQRVGKDWINFVKTSKAKSKIRSFLRTEQREECRKVGKNLLSQALESMGMHYDKFIKNSTAVDKTLSYSRSSNFEDLLIGIGFGKIIPYDILKKVFPKHHSKEREQDLLATKSHHVTKKSYRSKKSDIIVSGIDNVLVSLAKCCNPVPGDDILGYITRGRGVTVHVQDCDRGLNLDPARRLEVRWGDSSESSVHVAYLRVETKEQPGMLADITAKISAAGVNILKADAHVSKSLVGIFNFKISVSHLEQLKALIGKIEGIRGVISVERSS
ncbi:MAG: bifunctional (p)ppGpp synthetase/guanosine-3',5'-bis(diphosphate) 3'-pyrophosphohydrolase [Proteobacteria bacterium]|nr:bifunctional (p)ppGpp synthetase/guanosine-3',5'-bis(diphosphate) 3'-pyrophosphohydrolase [Pseudomonadota bacterium]